MCFRKHNQEMSGILFGVAAVGLIFAPVSLYRLSPFLVAAFMLVCLQQLMAKQTMPAIAPGAPTAAITEKAETQEEQLVSEEKLKQS
jgi:hypothetical protein